MASLLDQAISSPYWELPPSELDEPLSMAFAQPCAQIAATITRVGRASITWTLSDGTWGLAIVGGAVRVASPTGNVLTWIPGSEMNMRVSADDKLVALAEAVEALEALIAV